MELHRRFALAIVLLLLAACGREPVEWGDLGYRDSQLGDPDARSAIMSAGLPPIAGTAAPCIQTVRTAAASNRLVRVWWSTLPDSSVVLSLQHSTDMGKSWQPAVEVDSRDRGRRGCDRPAPGIWYDSASGYVYVVYFIEGSDGAGVFFAHSMNDGGMFHSPVPVVYGSVPSKAAVAGRGDNVVAVFEDPNSTSPRIGIALSRTTGHIFEQRSEVTPEEVRAIKPWVALAGDTVRVWWKTVGRNGEDAAERVGYRSGVWR